MKKRISLTAIANAIGIVNIVFMLVAIILMLTTGDNTANNPTIAFFYYVGIVSLGSSSVLRIIAKRRSRKEAAYNAAFEDSLRELGVAECNGQIGIFTEVTIDTTCEPVNSNGSRPTEISNAEIIAELEKPVENRPRKRRFVLFAIITCVGLYVALNQFVFSPESPSKTVELPHTTNYVDATDGSLDVVVTSRRNETGGLNIEKHVNVEALLEAAGTDLSSLEQPEITIEGNDIIVTHKDGFIITPIPGTLAPPLRN